jgi:serine/threonine protein phosphatase PrpC
VEEVAADTILEWGVASSVHENEQISGDVHFVREGPDEALFAVIDGLGHGSQAAKAAQCAVDTLESNCHDSIPGMIAACHDNQRTLRGVVMSLARIEPKRGTLTWLGVGNVFGVLLRAQKRNIAEHLLVRPGIVGANLPTLHEMTVPIGPGDALVMATDGVSLGILPQVPRHLTAQEAAERLLSNSTAKEDDQLVLVVNVRSAQP